MKSGGVVISSSKKLKKEFKGVKMETEPWILGISDDKMEEFQDK